MDARVIAESAVKRFCWDKNFPGNERLTSIIAEEIEKAQKPEKVKTRGEVVAEGFIRTHLYGGEVESIRFVSENETIVCLTLPSAEARGRENIAQDLRYELARIIDAERASAAKEERERLAAKFDQLGNQAAADVVRE